MEKVNNTIYDLYGDRWYTADDDPVALLRAESRLKTPWILEKIKEANLLSKDTKVLDVGCGAGFLSNELAQNKLSVTGVDLSLDSLAVARAHDATGSVVYMPADAYHLPFPDHSFDVVTAMDFLEHVDHPDVVIKEISRVLKPNGLFFFHTFNRNWLAYLVIIKLVEWFVKNTPKNMHVLHLFIKPRELEIYCLEARMKIKSMIGIRPLFSTITFKSLMSGVVPKALGFKLTKSLKLSYMGVAKKSFL